MKWFRIICLLLSGVRPALCADEQASRPAAVVDKAVARGIDYLISQQQTNGAIVTAPPPNQPNANALTGLSIMALTAVGHRPTDDSPAGHALCKALDFILDPKRQDTVRTPGYFGGDDNSRMYGHGIVTLMLAEMVGMGVDARQDEVIRDRYQRRLTSALERRRFAFYGKIEDAMDKPLEPERRTVVAPSAGDDNSLKIERRALGRDRYRIASMDDLLLSALTAHNREDYEAASRIYSEILAQRPEKGIAAVVYKHRGMAHFAQSLYKEAIEDFGSSLELTPDDHKAAYYRGVVKSVLQDYSAAIADFDLALGMHPYHFFALYRRAMAYWHLGDDVQSLADSEAALKLEPDNSQAIRLRDMAQRKLKM